MDINYSAEFLKLSNEFDLIRKETKEVRFFNEKFLRFEDQANKLAYSAYKQGLLFCQSDCADSIEIDLFFSVAVFFWLKTEHPRQCPSDFGGNDFVRWKAVLVDENGNPCERKVLVDINGNPCKRTYTDQKTGKKIAGINTIEDYIAYCEKHPNATVKGKIVGMIPEQMTYSEPEGVNYYQTRVNDYKIACRILGNFLAKDPEPAPSVPGCQDGQWTDLERTILVVLQNAIYPAETLAKMINKSTYSVTSALRKDRKLQKSGLVKNQVKAGYYRTDALPVEDPDP